MHPCRSVKKKFTLFYPEVAMNLPLHLFRLQSAPNQRDSEVIHVVTRSDVQWNTPTFRAPALPTTHQLHSELPFSVNFGPKRPRSR
jgi:hypothetical protein